MTNQMSMKPAKVKYTRKGNVVTVTEVVAVKDTAKITDNPFITKLPFHQLFPEKKVIK